MVRPFLSIVTISFNQKDYLRQALESVLSQKAGDVEYIVVDPGSSDGSRELLATHAGRIDHLVLEPDTGPADGLNKGFAHATGSIGYFLNSDDFLLPGSVEKLRELWSQAADFDILLCGAWMVDSQGVALRELRSTPVTIETLISGAASIVQQGMSFRMERFRKARGFNPANRTCWDLELLCELLRQGGKAVASGQRLASFRLHDKSLTGGAGGAENARRYQADLARIRADFGDGRHRYTGPAIAGSVLSAARFPGAFLSKLQDRVFPSRVLKRYANDIAGKS